MAQRRWNNRFGLAGVMSLLMTIGMTGIGCGERLRPAASLSAPVTRGRSSRRSSAISRSSFFRISRRSMSRISSSWPSPDSTTGRFFTG